MLLVPHVGLILAAESSQPWIVRGKGVGNPHFLNEGFDKERLPPWWTLCSRASEPGALFGSSPTWQPGTGLILSRGDQLWRSWKTADLKNSTAAAGKFHKQKKIRAIDFLLLRKCLSRAYFTNTWERTSPRIRSLD